MPLYDRIKEKDKNREEKKMKNSQMRKNSEMRKIMDWMIARDKSQTVVGNQITSWRLTEKTLFYTVQDKEYSVALATVFAEV